jgi:hypothetical protein
MPPPRTAAAEPPTETPLETMQSANASIAEWVKLVEGAADPTAVLGDSLKTLGRHLGRVEKALHSIPQDEVGRAAWQTASAEYRATLGAMKTQLEAIEMVLKIRAAGIKRRRAKMDAVAHWADLTHGIHSSRIY